MPHVVGAAMHKLIDIIFAISYGIALGLMIGFNL